MRAQKTVARLLEDAAAPLAPLTRSLAASASLRVEKDALEWSKTRLAELLGGVLAEEGGVRVCAAPALLSLTGEAFVNQRKGKLIPSYELELKLEWHGAFPSRQLLSPRP